MTETAYDLLPYSSYPFEQSSPENLAAIARLFGLEAPDFRRARVLELACSSGGNIIPLAELYPEAEFVGVDLSARELEEGQRLIDATGLRNVRLLHQSVTDIDPAFGQFDYIIAHGLLSWVGEDVQRHILRVCKENLSPTGVAYISYNTLPGWNLVNTVRDMMRFHTHNFTNPAEKTSQARAILKFMSEGLEGNESAHAKLLRDEMKLLSDKADYYLFHDHLSDVNKPMYFYQFMTMARERGLDYLGDTDLSSMLVDHLPKAVAEKLRSLTDIVQVEQYMDFFRNRRFRHTLLCHQGTPLKRSIEVSVFEQFHLQMDLSPPADLTPEKLADGVAVAFDVAQGKAKMNASSRISKLAFLALHNQHGAPASLDTLVADVLRRAPELDAAAVRQHMLREMNLPGLLFSGLLRLRLSSGRWDTGIAERPYTTKVVRYQARHGDTATNGRHQPVKLQGVDGFFVRLMDGTRTMPEIVDRLLEQEKAGELTISLKDVSGDAGKRELLCKHGDQLVRRLSRLALLFPAPGAAA